MSNFFAALDSDDEQPKPVKKVADKKKPAGVTPIAPVAEPSKLPRRNDRDDRSYGRGRGRAPPREGKRAYDRRSGTGRGKEIKKGGGGRGNWGSDKNEARSAEQNTVIEENEDGTKVEVPVDGEAPADAPEKEAEVEEEEEEEPEPEDNTMTLEEYMARKAEEQAASEVFAPVRVKELEVDEAFQKMALKKEETDFLVGGGIKQKGKKNANKGTKKQMLDVDIKVGGRVGFGGRGGMGGRRREGDGGGRGRGRGEFRGGRGERSEGGRGGGRGERRGGGRGGGRDGGARGGGGGRGGGRAAGGGRGGSSTNFNPADESAFPSL